MRATIEEQRAALKQLWPEIGAYCGQHGLQKNLLLNGLQGIPIDGQKLQACGEDLLLTRGELAGQAELSLDMVTKIMNGRRQPTAAVLVRLLRALDCRPADLFLDDPVTLE